MSPVFPYVRFPKVTQPDVPPTGFVDLVYDQTTGSLAIRERDGTLAEIGGAMTTSEILAELAGETLSVQGVTLSDTTGLVLPSGTLGLDSSGGIVIHDGTGDPLTGTSGGVPYRPGDPYRVQASVNVQNDWSPAQLATVGTVEYEIGRIPLSALQCSNGTRMVVSGKIGGYVKESKFDFVGLVLAFGFTVDGTLGTSLTLDHTKDFNLIEAHDKLVLHDNGGAIEIIALNEGSGAFLSKDGENPVVVVPHTSWSNAGGTGVTGASQDLIIYMLAITNAADPVATVNVDLSFSFYPVPVT